MLGQYSKLHKEIHSSKNYIVEAELDYIKDRKGNSIISGFRYIITPVDNSKDIDYPNQGMTTMDNILTYVRDPGNIFIPE